MPGPSPSDYDSQDAFMHACVPFYKDEGKPQAQAVAICINRWNSGKSIDLDKPCCDDCGDARTGAKEFSEELHPRDDHGRWTDSGGGDGSTITLIPGVGNLDKFIADNPKQPGERDYEWQARLVSQLPPETRSEVLFQTREQYEPVKYLADAAAAYRADHGLPQPKADITEQRVDLEKADRVGRAFENTPDQSGDPKVQAAFDDFKRQNDEQWHLLTDPPEKGGLGVKVDFVHEAEPYKSAAEQAADLRDNRHLSIATGLGGEHQASMTTEEYDRFRAVHDAFGHAAIGGGFDRHGEYQAWLMHESMYSGIGAKAMSSEYHGVNSAMWSGDPKNPGGTGKTVLLPDNLIQSPWDEHGNLVRKGLGDLRAKVAPQGDKAAITALIRKLGLDSKFAHDYSDPPWHPSELDMQRKTGNLLAWIEEWRTKDAHDVSDEPRDDHGRWTTGGGGEPIDSGGYQLKLEPDSGDGSSKDSPLRTTDVHTAALGLRDGKYVELDQARGTSTLLDEINKMVEDAKARGLDPKAESAKYDLCRASIPGSNLNCDQAVVESRTGMPQLKGVPTPGSPADLDPEQFPKNSKGEVDLGPAFVEHLRHMGIATTSTTVPAENLRASQRELNGGKVAGMANAIINGTMEKGSIFTTRDDYVVDGHHRWAATVGAEYKQGRSISMDVDQIDMSITDAIREANAFTEKMGIPHAAKGQSLGRAKSAATLSRQGARSLRSTPRTRESAMSTKRAVYESEHFKAFTDASGELTGEFEADVSVFGNVDLQGDRVMPGAFKSYITAARAAGDPIPVVWSHQWDDPHAHIGWVDPAQMRETGKSLRVRGHIDLDNPFAKQVAKLMAERRVKGWSFAYDVHDEKRAKDGANELLDLSIIEVGPTLKGANPEAQLITAKSLDAAALEYKRQKQKAGAAISSATAATLKTCLNLLEQAEDALESLLGLPSDEANAAGDAYKADRESRLKALIDGEDGGDESAEDASTDDEVVEEENAVDDESADDATVDDEQEIEEEAGTVEEAGEDDREPEAKSSSYDPDQETLMLRHRIEEMRQT